MSRAPIGRLGMRLQPVDGQTFQQHVDQAGKLDEVIEGEVADAVKSLPERHLGSGSACNGCKN